MNHREPHPKKLLVGSDLHFMKIGVDHHHIESVYTSHKCHEMRRKLHHVITLHNNEAKTRKTLPISNTLYVHFLIRRPIYKPQIQI